MRVNSMLNIYFSATEDSDKVQCKICKKSLRNQRNFNLKVHLGKLHNIHIREDRRISGKLNKKFGKIKEKKVEYDANAASYDSNEPFHGYSTAAQNESSTIDLKAEVIAEHDIIEFNDGNDIDGATEVDHTTQRTTLQTTEEIGLDDPLDVPDSVFSNEDNEFLEEIEPPNGHRTVTTDNHESKKKRLNVPKDLNETTPDSKEDKFEKWLKRRELILNIEYLEMRNYGRKVQLWEKEKQLKLPSSKFTKNIGVRTKK